ncbi:MAG: cation:proton antiporter [Deltaproteobacteria bacterium]|nr:cation:proton antiporter [Deltaproteobacteria bacterium]
MHLDPYLPKVVGAALLVLVLGMILRRLRQPHVIVYLLAGVLLGEHGLEIFAEPAVAARLGDFGVVLLLFFFGMEVSLPRLVANWKVAIGGTLLQILASVGLVLALGAFLDWPLGRSVLLGFVISLSSTAVVISILRSRGQLASQAGHDALGILLVQDMAVVPMLLVIGLLSTGAEDLTTVGLQVVGGVGIITVVALILRRGQISLPFASRLRDDHELQVFGAFVLCFGFATLTALFQLSTALGAFVAGIVVASARETEWVHRSLEPLRVLLVAVFFVSVGMMIDLGFVLEHLAKLLAQVGEFSFVLAEVGGRSGLISDFGRNLAVGIIALSLLVSPAWIAVVSRLVRIGKERGWSPSDLLGPGPEEAP